MLICGTCMSEMIQTKDYNKRVRGYEEATGMLSARRFDASTLSGPVGCNDYICPVCKQRVLTTQNEGATNVRTIEDSILPA